MPELYKTPFRPGEILRKRPHPVADIRRSIAQHLHLLLCTREGEYYFDETYGCPIWEYDFDNTPGSGLWREQMCQAIRDRISRFETRLDKPKVTVSVTQEFVPPRTGSVATFKRKMDVRIEAVLSATQEPFRFTNQIYITPFSYD